MKSFNLKKVAAVSALSLVALVGSSVDANAQGRGNNQRKQVQKIEKAQNKIEKQQAKIARKQMRIYRNGRYYNTDQRGADLLRQAVNAGYQQGLQAGRSDHNSRRRSSWTNSTVYRNGTYGYQTYVDRSQYQYYFQQGFQRGYQDGYNSRYQYGTNNGGTVNILGSILSSILNIQSY
ncbi:MAG: hypothetical protein ABI791_07510 [Acidobacteriota bacterium]